MDSLTHTVLGACLGEVIAGKKLGKQALFWGALANNIPDVDVVTSLWMTQADSLLAHRGFTHSILFALLFTPLLAYALKRWHKNKKMEFSDWVYIIGSGLFVHILIDAFTSYGTGWFEPFSHKRVTMNVLFVADPFYTLALLLSFIALIAVKARKKIRLRIAGWGLFISTAYLIYAFANKWTIDTYMKEELKRQKITYANYFTTPAPLNNFLWNLVAKNDSGFYIGYRSVFDQQEDTRFVFRPQNKYLLRDLPQDPDLLKLERFAKGYFTLERSGDSLYFNDIRFGTTGGWADTTADFVFRYCLDKSVDNDLVIQRGRMKSAGKEALQSLWKRAMGTK
jgi:inner membrane protein